jgi:uncharacterized protein YdeI (YjbR/CyaY-like superfamily)
MIAMNPEVDVYFRSTATWGHELAKLRAILLDCGLTEQLKWRKPCYTFQQGNVAVLMRYKEFVALNFLKGALLEDPDGVLVAPGENSQAARKLRFTSVREVTEREPALRAFLGRAIELEKAGVKVNFKAKRELTLPDELLEKFDELPALKPAFEALTPGRQRAYVLHISGAKQSSTRASRVERCVQRILDGKGLHDPD